MKIFLIFLLSITTIWGASSHNKVYKPIRSGSSITNIPQEDEISQTYISNKKTKFKTGNQQDIEEFNNSSDWSVRYGGYKPQPFSNRTNSYWIFPNFQYGPGSVNDFGNNPNAQQMVNPYIF